MTASHGREAPAFDEAFRERLTDLLVWRRDVRRFRREPISSEHLEASLTAFDLAPSVGNSQPWRIVSVESQAAREKVCTSFERCNEEALAAIEPSRAELYAKLKLSGLKEAPVQLAVFCDQETDQGHGLGTRTMPETLLHSTAGAVTLFALLARAYGIGVGWVSILEPDEVVRALDVPRSWTFVSYLCVGYPLEEDDVPELEREGWQAREAATPLIRR